MRVGFSISLVFLMFTSLLGAQEQPEPARAGPSGPPTRQGFTRQVPPAPGIPRTAGKPLSFEIVFAEVAEPLGDVTAKQVLDLEKTGKLRSLIKFRLATLEEQPAFVQVGELAPRVTGRTVIGSRGFAGGPGGPGGAGGRGGQMPQSMPNYSDVNVGTIAQVTARVDDDGAILAQLYVERSTLPPEARQAGALDQNPPPGIARILSQSTLRLAAGEPAIVSSRQAQDPAEKVQTWIVVTANIPASGGAAGK
jgi:hypothetical protein